MQHVADNRAGRRCHDAHHARQERQFAFAVFRKQSLGSELAFTFLKQRHQGANARRLQSLDHDLVLRRIRICRYLALGNDFHPLLGFEPEFLERTPPDDSINFRAIILQREIAVTGRMRPAIARNFTAQAHKTETVFK